MLLKEHDKCALHNKAIIAKGKALDFIWMHYMEIIMLTLYKDQTPDPIIVMDEIIIKIKAQIKAKPNCPVSHFLKTLLNEVNLPSH